MQHLHTELVNPPAAAVVRDVGLSELADLLQAREESAAAAAKARQEAQEAARQAREAREAAAEKAWQDSPTGRANSYQDTAGAAERETAARLLALNVFLAGLPREWDLDDEESAIARIHARQESERLRQRMWRAWRVASWVGLSDRTGRPAMELPDRSLTDPKLPNAWPIGDLSDDALAGLNTLMGTHWSITPIPQLITTGRYL